MKANGEVFCEIIKIFHGKAMIKIYHERIFKKKKILFVKPEAIGRGGMQLGIGYGSFLRFSKEQLAFMVSHYRC